MGFWKTLLGWVFGRKSGESLKHRPPRPSDATSRRPTITPDPPISPARIGPTTSRRDGHQAITIGLDFGTHSTKILLRPRDSDRAALLRINKPCEGYPSFACPSLVRVVDDRLCFGARALEVSGGTLYRSLKVQLLPPEGDDVAPQVFPSGLTPDLLVAWYLSWVLGRIQAGIAKYFKHGSPKLSLNVAAPMNHIENESLKARYLGIVQAAWESVFGEEPSPAKQGMPVDALRTRFMPWMEREVPGRETRPFEVLPETVAPIVSLSFDPRMDPGMYMIVDMGAGTTELSVNHVEEAGADQRVFCYEDQSARFGGDNFEWLEENCPETSRIADEMQALVEHFTKYFNRVWCVGYQKDGQNPVLRNRWRDFHVLLTGGGARRPEVERAVRNALPMTSWPTGERRYRVSWHEPTGIDLGAPDDAQSTSLLAVAHGLSVPRQKWPAVFPPGDIEVQDAPERIEQLPAYWYVD